MAYLYPHLPTAYKGSVETAFEAAITVAVSARNREAKALRLIGDTGPVGCTADEVALFFGWDRYSSRARLSSLKARGKIVDSGLRRKGVSGRRQAVWIVSELASERKEAEQ